MRRNVMTLALPFVVLLATYAQTAVAAPSGSVPPGLPARMTVGLFEGSGATWMKTSGVPWDVRYAYFVKGWVNNWGWGSYDGSFATGYFREAEASGYVPAIELYQMNGEVGGGENAFYMKTQNASTMASYFGDFKLLMQRAKEFGKPVIVMLEADGFAFLEQQTGNNPGAWAAIAATGMPELANLPNTAAGWGLAFLQIRKAVGANNVLLGIHVSGWASGKDIVYGSVTDPLQPEVDKVYGFLSRLGLTSNQTGGTYDFLVGDPCDRDADFYRMTLGQERWLDSADNASINSKSFNRYAEWLRLWNVKAAKRWVLWQIPLGNSNHLNVYNNGSARQGYKGNFPEYIFGANGSAHRDKLVGSGVISLLFGAGAGGQSSYENDIYSDGQAFMKSRAGNFLRAGGLTLTTSGSGSGSGGTSTSSDSAPFSFESGTQGFASTGAPITSVTISGAQKFAGANALALGLNGSGTSSARVSSPQIAAGKTVTFHVFVPASGLSWIQPYVLQGAAGNWAWTGNWQAVSSLQSGAWNTLTLQVPSNAASLDSLGVQLSTNGSYVGTVYIDSISY